MSVTIYRFTASDKLYKFLNLPTGSFVNRRWAYDKIIENSCLTQNTKVLEYLCENEGNNLRYNFLEQFEYKVTYDSIVEVDKSRFMDKMKSMSDEIYQIWLDSDAVFDIYDKTNNLQVLIDLEKDYIRSMEPNVCDKIMDKHVINQMTRDFLLEQLCYFHVLNLKNYIKISSSSFFNITTKSIIYDKGNALNGTTYLITIDLAA